MIRHDDYIFRDLRGLLTSPVASAIVFKKDDHVIAKVWSESHERWKRIARGEAEVDDASVINSALQALTPSRIRKERVVLVGSFEITDSIKVPGHTILDLRHAYIKLADNANTTMIKSASDTETKHVEIIGGILDGNGNNQSSTKTDYIGIYGIDLRYPQNVAIDGVTLVNTADMGILLGISPGHTPTRDEQFLSNSVIRNCYLEDIGVLQPNTSGKGIQVNSLIDFAMKNNTIINANNQGIQVVGSRHGVIEENYVKDCEEGGIWPHYGSEDIVVRKNTLINITDEGIMYLSAGNIDNPKPNIIIEENYIENASKRGIRVDYGYFTIRSNRVVGCNQGIVLNLASGYTHSIENVIIENNTIENTTDVGIQQYKAQSDTVTFKNIVYKGNRVINPGTHGIAASGGLENIIYENNYAEAGSGYYGFSLAKGNDSYIHIAKFEGNTGSTQFLYAKFNKNSGVATFSGDGTTADFLLGDHGLVITDPTKIVVKVTPISADAIAASPCVGYVDPADPTKIRVKFASAPASGTDNVQIIWEAQVVW